MWPVAHQGFASPGYAPLDPPPSTTAWYLVAHANFKRGSKKIHAFVFPPYRKGITFGACSLCTPWLTAFSSSLSDLMGRSEKRGMRVRFFTNFKRIVILFAPKYGKKRTVFPLFAADSVKSDRQPGISDAQWVALVRGYQQHFAPAIRFFYPTQRTSESALSRICACPAINSCRINVRG